MLSRFFYSNLINSFSMILTHRFIGFVIQILETYVDNIIIVLHVLFGTLLVRPWTTLGDFLFC